MAGEPKLMNMMHDGKKSTPKPISEMSSHMLAGSQAHSQPRAPPPSEMASAQPSMSCPQLSQPVSNVAAAKQTEVTRDGRTQCVTLTGQPLSCTPLR